MFINCYLIPLFNLLQGIGSRMLNGGEIEFIGHFNGGHISTSPSIYDPIAAFVGYLAFRVEDLFSLVCF